MYQSHSSLIDFYRGEAPDHQGRMIDAIWALSPFWLEHTHDYIQWLFPIPEAGRFNGFAPLLTISDREAFRVDASLRERQRVSLDMMLAFLGLERDGLTFTAHPDINIRDHIWLKSGGHNHLRISRMIRALALSYQRDLARAFQDAVIRLGRERGIVSETSRCYWAKAHEA